MGRKCVRRILSMMRGQEPAELPEGALAGGEAPGESKGFYPEVFEPRRCKECRHHHPDGREASPHRHGCRHRHMHHHRRSHPSGPEMVVKGMPAEGEVTGYPATGKGTDAGQAGPASPVHIHHHIYGETLPEHLREGHRRHGCRRHRRGCREHVHYHYTDPAQPAQGIPYSAVGQPAPQPAKENSITRRSSV